MQCFRPSRIRKLPISGKGPLNWGQYVGELWDHSPAPMIERLARIEGQSNFLSLLAGIEAGPDTTQDMGALSFSRLRGSVPEVLEAYVAQSDIFKRPLMTMIYDALCDELHPKESDLPWIRGAVSDAFLLVQKGYCLPIKRRARQFTVGHEPYGAMRSLAYGVLWAYVDAADLAFVAASRR